MDVTQPTHVAITHLKTFCTALDEEVVFTPQAENNNSSIEPKCVLTLREVSMNVKKHAAVTFFIAALTAGTFALQEQAGTIPPNIQETQSPQQNAGIPEHIPYRILFHQIYFLNQEADKAERQGKHAAAVSFRMWFKQDAGLTDLQTYLLNEVAASCEADVRQVDQRAKVIIDARRSYYPNGRLMPGQEPLPPSEELKTLQQERNETILRCRDRLQKAFGEKEFARFAAFVKRKVNPTITVALPGQQPITTGSSR